MTSVVMTGRLMKSEVKFTAYSEEGGIRGRRGAASVAAHGHRFARGAGRRP